MLYTSFRVAVMTTAFLGLLHMLAEGSFIYIFFPIAIIIWAIYSFFDENDREYLRRNGVDPDEVSWFFPEYCDYGTHRTTYQTSGNYRKSYPARNNYSHNNNVGINEDYNRYAPQYPYSNPIYRKLKDKCKRNFKITIFKEEEIKKNDAEN